MIELNSHGEGTGSLGNSILYIVAHLSLAVFPKSRCKSWALVLGVNPSDASIGGRATLQDSGVLR